MEIRDSSRHFEARFVACGTEEVVAIVRDITERKRAEERIRFLAYYDEITGLPNRQLFNETLNHALGVARRYHHVAAVLYLDVDRFKRFNDTLGHRTGNLLLQEIAARIAASVRSSDAIARFGAAEETRPSVARLGGDEFTVLVNEIQRVEDAALVARRILDCFGEPVTVEGRQLYTTCSIGIAVFPTDGEDADTLLKNADTAMYHAKETGRNNYQFYSESMNATALERLSLETMLRQAVDRDELRLYYQPQINLLTGKISGVEALLRWHHPELGLIGPAAFISLAEETGLIVPMGEWALRTACAQNKAWQEAGLPPIRVAVNLSAQQFREAGVAKMVEQALTDTGLVPEYLEIEITESIAMADGARTVTTLSQLKAIGITMALDDFGTGYSSLAYLKRFPIDTLKIDRSFVRDLAENPDDAAIATAILALARTLQLDVVAEGVESEAQLEFLRKAGCTTGQGYLFARPAPAEEIAAKFANMTNGQQRLGAIPAAR
jgi:diguanylate cyclase (GGDEF)-like protein